MYIHSFDFLNRIKTKRTKLCGRRVAPASYIETQQVDGSLWRVHAERSTMLNTRASHSHARTTARKAVDQHGAKAANEPSPTQ